VVVTIRPQGVRINPTGVGIPGRVEFRRFLGETDLLEILVEGLARPLRARMRDTGRYPKKREVTISIDPAEVLVFAVAGA